MFHWWTVFGPVLAIYGVMAAGIVLRRASVLTEEADRSLLRVVINVLAPCLILSTVVANPALRDAANVWLPPLVGFAGVALGFGIALLLARTAGRALGLATPAQCATFAFCIGVYNYGYIPIPLVEDVFAADPAVVRGTLGVLFVHNVGVELAMFTVGLAMLARGSGTAAGGGWWRAVVNPPSVSIVVALLLNLVDWSFLPGFLQTGLAKGVGMLGACAVPMALLLIGATIDDHLGDLRGGNGRRGVSVLIVAAALLRLAVLPATFLAVAWMLRRLPGEMRASDELVRVMVIQAAMPSAVMPIVLARHYGGDPATALRVVLGTSIISLVTIPIWVAVGLGLFGG